MPFGLLTAISASGIATPMAMILATNTRNNVFGNHVIISSSAGFPLTYELPKSSINAPFNQRRY